MSKLNKEHEKLMRLLDQVPGVEDRMKSFQVQMGEQILELRLQANLTQTQVVRVVRYRGEPITQATISKVECGDTTVSSETYSKVLKGLGGISNLSIEFGELPRSTKSIIEYV